jgi:hypothetical protein
MKAKHRKEIEINIILLLTLTITRRKITRLARLVDTTT